MYVFQSEVIEREENTLHMNVGPSHPATHGTLRLKLEIQGERIVSCEQEIGFLHTGFEKLGEHRSYNQFVTVTDRMNYISPLANNIGYAVVVEEMMGIELPRRGKLIRVILAEMSRVADHIFSLGTMTMDLGAFSSVLWAFVEREKMYDIFEAVTGTRLTTSYTRIGGLAFDLPDDFEKRSRELCQSTQEVIDRYRDAFLENPIFLDRTKGVGVISKEDVLSYGITGPIGRASGVNYDLRRFRPYLNYNEFTFDVPVYTEGDSFARYIIRLDEMEQSLRSIEQALDMLEPVGPGLGAPPVFTHHAALAPRSAWRSGASTSVSAS